MAKRGPKVKVKRKGKRPPKLSNPFPEAFGNDPLMGLAASVAGMLGIMFGMRADPKRLICPVCHQTHWPHCQPPRRRVKVQMSREEAARFIAHQADSGDGTPLAVNIRTDPQRRKNAYREAARRLHPDNKATGNHELFVKLQEAMEVLEGPNA